MEILVLSTLQWKMNPVTPLSFLDYIARRLGLKSNLFCEFLRRCECLLLSIIADYRFMCYLPSTLANATMMYVFSNLRVPRIQLHSLNRRNFGSLPGSPKGVVDVSFSFDSSNDSWAVYSSAATSVSFSSFLKMRGKKLAVSTMISTALEVECCTRYALMRTKIFV